MAFPKHMGYMGCQYQANQNNFNQNYPYGNCQNHCYVNAHNPNYYFNSQINSGMSGHVCNQYEQSLQFNIGQINESVTGPSMIYQHDNYQSNYHTQNSHQGYCNQTHHYG